MVSIALSGLGASYGRKLTVSEVTTPRFSSGEVVAVIGPNAAGKSTLFKRMAGLLRGPGEVSLEGSGKGRRAFGYMPQDTSANAVLTVYESILLARKQGSGWRVDEDDLRLIDEVMAAIDITPIAFRSLGELSGGQRQLVGIAQALVREPDILLMDEPTSALDLHRQMEVLAFLRQAARQRGIIVFIALHDLNQAMRFADQAWCCRTAACAAPAPSPRSSPVPPARGLPHRRAHRACSRGLARSSSTASKPRHRTMKERMVGPPGLEPGTRPL